MENLPPSLSSGTSSLRFSADDCNIIADGNRGYKTTFEVSRECIGMIIGTRGATKRRIEAETRTQIDIPRPGGSSKISIMGYSPTSVAIAKKKIDAIISSRRPEVTHFVCIPFNQEHIMENFLKFQNMLLADDNIVGLNESYFQNPLKLHLTVEILSIKDQEGCILAAQTLENCCESVIRPIIEQHGTVEIDLKGLGYMNTDPSKVHILYGAIESDIVQKICDAIAIAFNKTGLMARQLQSVKMHVTLINSKFTETEETTKRQPIDCTQIIQKYKNFSFGTIKLTEIHISEMNKPKDASGFYRAITIAKVG